MSKEHDIYCSAVSRDFVTPARRPVAFSNVPINSSLEAASIVSREINMKSCPPTESDMRCNDPRKQRMLRTVRNARCSRDTHVKRSLSFSPAGFDFFRLDSLIISTSRSTSVALVTITPANCASECNYNFIQINFRGGNVLSC